MPLIDTPVTIFWFRRDLRLSDNHGLYRALTRSSAVLPVFIFDRLILGQLPSKQDRRVSFIHTLVDELNTRLTALGSALYVLHEKPVEAFALLTRQFRVHEVIANHDYEPYAIERDAAVSAFLATRNIALTTYKDQVVFEKDEITKSDGTPYTVFTPYAKAWKRQLSTQGISNYPSEQHLGALARLSSPGVPGLDTLGFEAMSPGPAPLHLQESTLRNYDRTRNIPGIAGTSLAGPHLRFGAVSIRHLVRLGLDYSDTWLNELIWREFFMMILFHFPYVVHGAFKKQYELIRWRNDPGEFDRWRRGDTGYPIVDAGMRQLNATGWMPNRVRMIAASFLVKDLLVDWRWGEAWFAEKLIDYELASNNGNWQWVAGTGCDAAPWFRIFNPHAQTLKFDPSNAYIDTWVREPPSEYPSPIVDHATAKARALLAYKEAFAFNS